MPQLDTSTWSTVIMTSLVTLFIILQLKLSSFNLTPTASPKQTKFNKTHNPWDKKWTKIYLPLSLPLH
uniref:ATP synthase complex subunit 8 n=1 Tax=Spalax golani TaxID=191382 RepID=G5D5L7_SPAGO|nr:ATP synthase F0 subunit 8 [Nannospalax golani]AEP83200.1 ATP synthase F0 subunit 8 [Nannospalax golani]AEP83252.1 ATP synthase F0 subunit 8 [Nannospalax golani]